MNKEEWLINEVERWQDDSIIDKEAGEKIKKQYELYRSFSPNIFTILFAILGATLIAVGGGIAAFYSWGKMTGIGKLIVSVLPLIISYIVSIYTLLFKSDNKIWKESSAFLNVVSMFLALGVIVLTFRFNMTFSEYLLISSILTIPVLYIMQAVSPLIIYYVAILMWGSLNISFGNAPILLVLFLLGVGLIAFNIRTFNKSLKYHVTLSALIGLPFMLLFVKMLNGDFVIASLLYSTIMFAARDVKRHYFPLKSIAILTNIFTIICMTTSHAWISADGKFGGILLGILTGLILLASLALEVFNTKDNNYEFSYLLILMGLTIIRYIWGCIHSNEFIFQMIFMGIGILVATLIALAFVLLGKSKKRMSIAIIGFAILGITILIKVFETNLFFLGRVIGFLAIGIICLVLVIILSNKREEENNEAPSSEVNKVVEDDENMQDDEGGQFDEEDNIIS